MKRVTLLFLFAILFISCSSTKTYKVALSKGVGSVNYEAYGKWINRYDKDIEIVNLYGYSLLEAIEKLNKCDALVLTGGPDVHPFYYNKPEDSSRCSIDNYRDSLEFALIKEASNLQMPVMAICRGAQIANVAYGGDLIVDIPSDVKSEISHQEKDFDAIHEIIIEENSFLNKISGTNKGEVNSNHHQAVNKLADIFQVSARSKDGIIEAYEMKDKTKPFFIAVQWHPERLDSNSLLSYPLSKRFIDAIKNK